MKIDIRQFCSEEEVEQLAKACAFVERKSPITGFKFFLVFTAGALNTPDGTLAQLAAFLFAACETKVSPQALDERLTVAGMAFMRACFEKVLAMARRPRAFESAALARFAHVYIIDSTNFDLHPSLREIFKGSSGSGSTAAMRIQLVLDYLTGRVFVEIGDTQLTDAPTLQRFVAEHSRDTSGPCLFLFDLGYFKLATFENIQTDGQFFLSKLKFGVTLHDATGTPLDLKALLKKQPEALDLVVTIGSTTYRLVGQRLPEEIVNQRLRNANRAAKRKRGGTITDDYRLFLSYALFLTNLPSTYGMQSLFTLYRLRWQIELVFKTWKSILAIHKIRSGKFARVMCEVYGKLILAAYSSTIAAGAETPRDTLVVSLHRAMRHLQTVAMQWALAMRRGGSALIAFIAKQTSEIARLCKKNQQKKRPTIEILLENVTVPSPGRPNPLA